MDPGDTMNRHLLSTFALVAALAGPLAGCVVAPYPPPYTPGPTNYDRAFSAAAGALRDQGLTVNVEDPSRGVVVGQGGNASVQATVARQADGTVRVQFDAKAPQDPTLVERISRSYDRRMGR